MATEPLRPQLDLTAQSTTKQIKWRNKIQTYDCIVEEVVDERSVVSETIEHMTPTTPTSEG